MQFGPPRGAERIYIKDGVMKNGRIVARKVTSYFDSGAYTRLSSYAAIKCAAHIPGPYTIPNVHADVYCVFTNRTPSTAMRGFGVTGVDFAIEVQMDKLAHLIDMDPMEFRILNAYRDGDMKAHRRTAKNCALIECVQVAAEKAKWPIREEFRRMSSRIGGGDARAAIPSTTASDVSPPQSRPGRVSYERLGVSRPAVSPVMAPSPTGDMPAPPPAPPPAAPTPAKTQHGVARFSSVFGTRRR
jgi:CO/xanthine dehydrogenase Mo-binding subunit